MAQESDHDKALKAYSLARQLEEDDAFLEMVVKPLEILKRTQMAELRSVTSTAQALAYAQGSLDAIDKVFEKIDRAKKAFEKHFGED
jgi:hypothetical protein